MVEWVTVLLDLPDLVNVAIVDDPVVVVVGWAVVTVLVVVVVAPSTSFDVLNSSAEPDSHRL
jgi:hypothetical protein